MLNHQPQESARRVMLEADRGSWQMTDVFTKTKRSAVMALIRGAGNRDTELRLIALLRAHGITGWRRGALLQWKVDRGKLNASFRVRLDFDFAES